MSDHVHLLLRTGRLPLVGLMQRLLTGYAVSGGENRVGPKQFDLLAEQRL